MNDAAATESPLRDPADLVAAIVRLSSARDLPSVMAAVRTAARRLTGADGATFVLLEGGSCYYADEDAIGPLWKGHRFPADRCITGWCMRHREPVVIEDVFADPRIPTDLYRPTFVRSLAVVPIRTEDPIGAIGNYWASPHVATAEQLALLQSLADSASVALENARVNATLERVVQERTARLETVNQELEAFTASVSHDLRGQITVLDGLSRLMALHRGDPERVAALSGRMDEAVARMNRITEDLLHLARMSVSPLERTDVDLSDLARVVADGLLQRHPGRTVRVDVAPGERAAADAGLVRILLENLLGNAVKFTRDRDVAHIRFGRSAPGTWFVADDGAGFDPARADRLFLPFQRLHDAASFEGTGIGLATAARIVARHGGRIWAEGRPGAGATFHFTLGDQPSEGLPASR